MSFSFFVSDVSFYIYIHFYKGVVDGLRTLDDMFFKKLRSKY